MVAIKGVQYNIGAEGAGRVERTTSEVDTCLD